MKRNYDISFCTVCMNRTHHLQKTLPVNIKHNLQYPNLTHVLLDYNSSDGLEQWVKQNLFEYVCSGRLSYYRTPDPEKFNMAHSKNMVAKLATGEIVCLIDADNYTGENYADYVNDCFNKDGNIFITTIAAKKVKQTIDVLGRICCWKNDFLAVEGLDEAMSGYGFDDYDFANRLQLLGRRRKLLTSAKYLKAIEHSMDERTENMTVKTNLQDLFISHIQPYKSNLLFLFRDHSFKLGSIINNDTQWGSEIRRALSTKRFKYKERLDQQNWIIGKWLEDHNNLVLDFGRKTIVMKRNSINGKQTLQETNKQQQLYFRLEHNKELINALLLFCSKITNRNRMELNLKNKKIAVNQSKFGAGTVFLNFKNNDPVYLV